MPVSQTSTITHHLLEASVRMDAATLGPASMAVVFQRSIDGVPDRLITCAMGPAELGAYLGASPAPGVVRGIDLTEGIYAWAVAAGHITGEVS